MSRKADLHIHTFASDGQWSESELLEQIDANEIKIFAVSDHDEIGAVAGLDKLTKNKADISFIKGVEISTTYEGREHHILTYGIDESDQRLIDLLDENRRIRDDYNDRLIEFLRPLYPQVDTADYHNYVYNPFQGGWRTFGYLKDRGVITDLRDYFTKIRGFDYEKKFYHPKEMIPRLNALGYVTILAHPPAYAEGDLYDHKDLDNFRAYGIQGLECYTQYMKDLDNAEYYVAYCNQYDLFITGGSDCHGGFAGRRLGYPAVTEDILKLWTLK